MFTGIIEECGQVVSLVHFGRQNRLSVRAEKICSDLSLGDSISVNGICLTAVEQNGNICSFDLMPETLSRTSLTNLSAGDFVNLERAMPASGRFGGHLVLGHIDGVGTILSVQKQSNAVLFSVSAAPAILRFIVEKGSIALDGISLTVVSVSSSQFVVSVIPHTLNHTILARKKRRDPVNLETDCIGKYIEKLIL